MPELPDVETVVRMLRRTVRGRRIRSVHVRDPRVVRSPSAAEFARRLRGRTIRRLDRRGKYIVIRLSGGDLLIAHLRMTGDFQVVPAAQRIHRHTRVIFRFGRDDLRFVDQRRFGHMDLVSEEERFVPLRRLGVEPLHRTFTVKRFRSLLDRRRGAIKSLLLRQDLIAGIGNIYADEILWQARIHPARPVDTLPPAEVRRLYRSIRRVLQKATEGLSRYGEPVGRLLAVRDREAPCPRCGRPLAVRRIAGRTTYFCSTCQR